MVWVSWNGRVGPEAEAEGDMGPLDCMRYSRVQLSLAPWNAEAIMDIFPGKIIHVFQSASQ